MTLDSVRVDLGRGAFCSGQTYVALSRCRTLEGISLDRPISMKDVKADGMILDFYGRLKPLRNEKTVQPGQLTLFLLKERQRQLTVKRVYFMTISSLVNGLRKLFGARKRYKFGSHLTQFDDRDCPKCGSKYFSYDSYWKESCCTQCGWTVPGYKATKPGNIQNAPVANQFPKNHKQDNLNGDNKFSYSRISLFEKCPKAYYFKYLLMRDELFSTIEQHLGKSIHATLEKAYRIKDAGGNISLDFLNTAFEQAWNDPEGETIKVIKNNMTSRDYYLDGRQMLKKYYHRVLSTDRSETLALEKYFEISIDNSVCYRGYIDRISRNPNGVLRITDYTNTVKNM